LRAPRARADVAAGHERVVRLRVHADDADGVVSGGRGGGRRPRGCCGAAAASGCVRKADKNSEGVGERGTGARAARRQGGKRKQLSLEPLRSRRGAEAREGRKAADLQAARVFARNFVWRARRRAHLGSQQSFMRDTYSAGRPGGLAGEGRALVGSATFMHICWW
jgi:hypothetical protein